MFGSKLRLSVIATLFIALSTLVSCATSNETAPTTSSVWRAINPPGAEVSPNFSNGILAGNTMYVAGTQGTDSKGNLADGIGPQTTAALQNIGAILKACNFSLSDVVAVNVYLSDIHDFGDMNKAYVAIMPDPKPTRTTVQVAALVNGAKIEISAIAVKH
jgi:2-iminobutanoate/2-iminopropanoate deaminase